MGDLREFPIEPWCETATPESIAAARRAANEERAAIQRQCGVQINEDGQFADVARMMADAISEACFGPRNVG